MTIKAYSVVGTHDRASSTFNDATSKGGEIGLCKVVIAYHRLLDIAELPSVQLSGSLTTYIKHESVILAPLLE